MKILVLVGAALASTALLVGCGDSASQMDLRGDKVQQVEPEGVRAYHAPDQFPNVVTWCIVGGHRIITNTRDSGNMMVVVQNDPSCGVVK